MKTSALTSTVFALTASTLLGQGQSDIEFLRARADAHERKIVQLENEINKLKSYRQDGHTASARPAAKPAKPVPSAATYVVKKGDVLTRIAYRNKTTVAAIMKVNGLQDDRIRIGQKLRIPGVAGSATVATQQPASTGQVEMKKSPVTQQKSAGKHVVKSGETFYSIARQYKVSVQSLMDANPSVKPSSMRVGQNLVINGHAKSARPAASSPSMASKKSASRSKATASKPKSKAKGTRAAVASKKSSKKASKKEVVRNTSRDRVPASTTTSRRSEPAIRTITVHQQMTYGQFASKYGASTTQLNALNGLSLSKNTMLAKGSELYVPKF